ncbi:glutaminase A [Actinomadura rubrisoli]|uniref:Glutaminase n=1 Tax=Actinomadura rubrisoli TaxID=2530368 RepID=A0A4R5B6Q8_9ACTN|nr:glutaminase A [Actinomadura rubrisoli]TDD81988.1 glutaminase A [Actinomadura rubrisoli]
MDQAGQGKGRTPRSRNTQRTPGDDPYESDYLALFAAFDDDASGTLERDELLSHLAEVGILPDDPRVQPLLEAAGDVPDQGASLDYAGFRSLIEPISALISRVAGGRLAVPDFGGLAADIDRIYADLQSETGGKVADYIPQLAQVDPDQFAISVCTVDGQRHTVGDADEPFCLQSISKAIGYCLALEEHGVDKVHQHVGREPSGVAFNALTLNPRGRPHNPMINAGAIMCCSLIRPGGLLADRFDHVMRTWERLTGRRPGYANATYLSERATADRNFALAYFMRENGAFPRDTDIVETLEFYFQCCSIEITAQMLAVAAATLANGGVNPLTRERVFSEVTVQHCLSLMVSCGMYDYSGEFAFTVGLPAKSGVAGDLMVVVPQLLGVSVWSPRLDELGNTVRGIEVCNRLVELYQVHPHATSADAARKDLRKRRGADTAELVTALCWAAGQGDLGEVRRLAATGVDLSAANYDLRTALHLAASEGRTDVVEYLLAHGADPGRVDRRQATPLDDAERDGHGDVADLLRAATKRRPPVKGQKGKGRR